MKKRLLSVLLALTLAVAMFPVVALPRAKAAGMWIATWGSSIVNGSVTIPGLSLRDYIPSRSTIRVELPVTANGSYLRFKFSNEFGKTPLAINELSVAKTQGNGKAAIISGTAVPITFNGNGSVSIPAGQTVWSDEIYFPVQALEYISISMYFRNLTYISSTGLSNGRTFLGKKVISSTRDSQVNASALTSPSEINISSGTITYHTIPFLANIDTYTEDPYACSAVFIGDSTLVNNAYLHYAERLVDADFTSIGVVNEAIIGNKLLSKGTGLIGNLYGPSLMDRFYRDALDLAGVKYVFVKIGLNDILHQFSKSMGNDVLKCSTDDIINGYKQLVTKAYEKGIKVYFFTKSPWKGYSRAFLGQTNDLSWSQEAQNMCDTLDQWIRNNNFADGYIDCHALANPADPNALCPSFTPDGAHLTEIGSIALADLIPLSYVDAYSSYGRSAAEINNVSPYAEMAEIQSQLNNGTYHADSSSNSSQSSNGSSGLLSGLSGLGDLGSLGDLFSGDMLGGLMDMLGGIGGGSSGSDNNKNDSKDTTKQPASTEQPSFPGLPETPANASAGQSGEAGQTDATLTINDGGQYVVDTQDGITGETEKIGGNRAVIFVMILFLVILAAGTAVLLTVNKKKETEFIN
ncbi:MAG: hypothetical protein IJK89_08485 [Clostridia bacterium]|nr:hypothetical protein [Clostridia bacterium]